MTVPPCAPRPRPSGFTLIEVIAAMVIFAMGVLMVIQLNTSLAARMAYAARSSSLVVLTHMRLDSLESMPVDSISAGVAVDTIDVEGLAYSRTVQVTSLTGLLFSIDVSMAPLTAGAGPSYSAWSFAAADW